MSFHEYHKEFNSSFIRGEDFTQCPQITREQIIKHSLKKGNLLDIGCGSAYKTALYTKYFHTVFGLEPSPDLLETAKNWLKQSALSNIHLIAGIAEKLPFEGGFFDVVSSVLSWWDAAEVKRVLKSDGIFIMEGLGPDDKAVFTKFFGEDEHGMRGACLNNSLNEIKNATYSKLSPYFDHMEFYESRWKTAYTAEGLWILLNNTKSTVRNFNPHKDKSTFDKAIKQLEKNGQIILTQNRITIVARDKKSPA